MQTFDTHEYIKDLQQGNVPLKQAEAHSNALKKVLNEELATKRDLNELETKLNTKMENLEAKIDSKISEVHIQLKDLEGRLNTKMENLEGRLNTKIDGLEIKFKENIISLIKWLVPLLLGQAALIIALLKYFGFAPAGG